jgi:hypothetical protein
LLLTGALFGTKNQVHDYLQTFKKVRLDTNATSAVHNHAKSPH